MALFSFIINTDAIQRIQQREEEGAGLGVGGGWGGGWGWGGGGGGRQNAGKETWARVLYVYLN